MKVLFAVSNENISESIVKKYQREYKEIISSKNVYYFNAIQKELQKDNTYDRIVISEDLEPYTNNNYDTIDKFIFDKLDAISDEATNSRRNDTPIILICSDRREKSEEMLVKLFSIGVYDAVLGNDRNFEEICKLIRKPRTKKEAKMYYRIDTDDVKYETESNSEVSEVEIQNILNYYKKLGKNEDKFAEGFENIALQYNEDQLKVIANVLPLNVKAVLESTSPTYKKIMTSSVGNYKKSQQDNGLSMNFIKDKTNHIDGNIIVPSVVNKQNVRKVDTKNVNSGTTTLPGFEYIDDDDVNNKDIQEVQQKRRGRPRKNPLPDSNVEPATPKKRGRPRKNPLPVIEENKIEEEPVNLFDIPEQNNQTGTKQETVLPGFEDINIDEMTNDINNIKKSNFDELNIEEPEMQKSDTTQIASQENYNQARNVQGLLSSNKKLVAFVGTSKNGTSFLVNNLAQIISETGINTAILDTTKNKNSYYIYTQNEEQLRNVAEASIKNLQNGIAQGINVNSYLTVYTAIPEEDVGINNYEEILSTLVQNYDLVLIDCDFDTNPGYFDEVQEIYLVQSLDVLTIQPLTAFLRDLKSRNNNIEEKLRIIINKDLKVRGLTDKAVIGGMSYYNEPSMSFMTELFNRENIKYCSIPFEEQTYSKYLEGLVNCKISLHGYSKIFMQSLKQLMSMVYPILGEKNKNKKNYKPVQSYEKNNFSQGVNDTLNQMKKNY